MQPESRHTTRRRCADPVGERLDVGRQVGRTRLLARLDQHDAPRVRTAGGAHRLDRGQARERRVPVVGAAAPVQAVALEHRRPRAEPLAPAVHLRLLVEVPVEQHGVGLVAAADGRHLDHDHRRAAGQLVHVDGRAVDRRATRTSRARGRRRAACVRARATRGRTPGADVRDRDVVVTAPGRCRPRCGSTCSAAAGASGMRSRYRVTVTREMPRASARRVRSWCAWGGGPHDVRQRWWCSSPSDRRVHAGDRPGRTGAARRHRCDGAAHPGRDDGARLDRTRLDRPSSTPTDARPGGSRSQRSWPRRRRFRRRSRRPRCRRCRRAP